MHFIDMYIQLEDASTCNLIIHAVESSDNMQCCYIYCYVAVGKAMEDICEVSCCWGTIAVSDCNSGNFHQSIWPAIIGGFRYSALSMATKSIKAAMSAVQGTSRSVSVATEETSKYYRRNRNIESHKHT
jgi:hypothetical protein